MGINWKKSREVMLAAVAIVAMLPIAAFAVQSAGAQNSTSGKGAGAINAHGDNPNSKAMQAPGQVKKAMSGYGEDGNHAAIGKGHMKHGERYGNETDDSGKPAKSAPYITGNWTSSQSISGIVHSVQGRIVDLATQVTDSTTNVTSLTHLVEEVFVPRQYSDRIGLGRDDNVSVTGAYPLKADGSAGFELVPFQITVNGQPFGNATSGVPVWQQ
jgi:hypothetical protein